MFCLARSGLCLQLWSQGGSQFSRGARERERERGGSLGENGVLLPGEGWQELVLTPFTKHFLCRPVQRSVWETATKMNMTPSFPAEGFTLQWKVRAIQSRGN